MTEAIINFKNRSGILFDRHDDAHGNLRKIQKAEAKADLNENLKRPPNKAKVALNDFVISELRSCRTVVFARVNLKSCRSIIAGDEFSQSKNLVFLNDDIIRQVSRRLESNLNQFFFRKAALRYGLRSPYFAFVHTLPQTHIHMLFGLPENNDRATYLRTMLFVKGSHVRDQWITADIDCQKADSVERAVRYSSRGNATLIL